MSKEAKKFQIATANRIDEIFRSGRQKRVLLADEVGLGKTIIAREVIDRVRKIRSDFHDDMYRVVYVCSNINIVHQNTKNLGMKKRLDISESRLSMQHLVIQEQVAELKNSGKYRADGKYEDEEMPELLIPLTPGTSFSMQQGCGNKNERALIYCLISRMSLFKEYSDELYEFFKYYSWLNEESWSITIDVYETRVNKCGEDYVVKIQERLNNNELYKTICQRLIEYLDSGSNNQGEKSYILTRLRIVFAELSIEELEPDFVIMDEFQRFSSLITDNPNDVSDQALITRRFFKTMDDRNAPLILLLSATPYKPYSTLEELNEESCDAHYEDFIKLTNFLFTDDKAEEFKAVWRDYSIKLSHLTSSSFDMLRISKNTAEDMMYGTMCRTERLMNSLIDMTQYVEEEPISSGDILSYCQMQKILRSCREIAERRGLKVKYSNVPMEYVKSSPYLLSFMETYILKKYIKESLHSKRNHTIKLPLSNWSQSVLLKYESIWQYKRIDSNNARLARLIDIMLDENKRTSCLLWIPASHPYYKTSPDNVFEQNSDFSKMLVFSSWEMVPRMIAFMLSYEAERQTIGSYTGGKKYPTYFNSVGEDSLRNDREILRHETDYLCSLYDASSENYFGKEISLIRESIATVISKRINDLGGFIVCDENFKSSDVIEISEWLNRNIPESRNVPEKAINILADMAIASPAVVVKKCIGDVTATDDVTRALIAIFNTRQGTGIMSKLYGTEDEFYVNVLKYCVEGNLQSVMDEFVHTIDETGDNKAEIAQTIYESFAGTNTIEIDTTEYYKDTSKQRRRFRTHFAQPFTNKKVDEKNVSHAINIRQSFNSPFRPFVLSTTSIGQEGLDFHLYCRKIMHWNIPSNPQDMEQREGRINRYKCLAIRRNVAHKYCNIFSWNDMFDKAYDELKGTLGGLIPFWCIPIEKFHCPEKIERIVPMYPLSSDREYYNRMNSVLALYRLTMGQPRQEELLGLFSNLTEEQMSLLLFNLSPIKKQVRDSD